jgi:hypothetical protein
MQNFVVHGFLGGIAEMDAHLVGGGPDTPVENGGVRRCWLNCSYILPSFLAVGRNP